MRAGRGGADDRAPDGGAGRRDGPGTAAPRRPRTAAERLTLAVGAALIAAVVALVVVLDLTDGNRPPVVVATPLVADLRQDGGRYYLPLEVTNRGDDAAEDVVVRADLVRDGATETAEFTIDVLAGGETTEATVVFGQDPTAGTLAAGVVSFR
jgi:uncharacterized protein (TIGR02588 family)